MQLIYVAHDPKPFLTSLRSHKPPLLSIPLAHPPASSSQHLFCILHAKICRILKPGDLGMEQSKLNVIIKMNNARTSALAGRFVFVQSYPIVCRQLLWRGALPGGLPRPGLQLAEKAHGPCAALMSVSSLGLGPL